MIIIKRTVASMAVVLVRSGEKKKNSVAVGTMI